VPTAVNGTIQSNSGGFPIVQTDTATGKAIGEGQLPDLIFQFLLHITINENETVTADVEVLKVMCRNGSATATPTATATPSATATAQ
jgi:hypothetical protein